MAVPVPTPRPSARQAGFTLLELVVVVAILSVLAGVLVPVVGQRLQRSRDARRMQDLKLIVRAVEDYLYDTGELPEHDPEVGSGGWDTTTDGLFLSRLVEEGYLRETLRDPVNDESHHYRYHRYPAGQDGFPADFYVVGILNFETDLFEGQKGSWKGRRRDWSKEFAYVAGGLAR